MNPNSSQAEPNLLHLPATTVFVNVYEYNDGSFWTEAFPSAPEAEAAATEAALNIALPLALPAYIGAAA